MSGSDGARAGLFMLAALVPTLGYILVAATAPAALARSWQGGSPISLGLLLGLALCGWLVAIALAYTLIANRRDRA